MHLLLRVPWCIWRHAAAVAIHVCRLPGPMVLPRLPVLMVLQAPMVFSLHESVQSARAAPPRVCNGCCGVRGAKARRWRGSRQRLLRSSAEIALRGPGHRDESQVIRAVRPLTVCKAPRRKIRELRGLRVSAAGCSHRTMNRPLATGASRLGTHYRVHLHMRQHALPASQREASRAFDARWACWALGRPFPGAGT